ncbi:metabotropic glutamate receptor 1-like [Mercenaria mercenaria]|uniref:metabotropic glutamate receptor 1-like n=1 Tax=Mercenaria mercenaria TaxID=6596 RepID=UPI001E1D394F|nr:metabotropic glutamate receptor 1-like [Mercenaria mercenaria]
MFEMGDRKFIIWRFCIVLTVIGFRNASEQRSARRDGNIILGALFPVHRPPHDTSRYTRSCGEIWEQYGIHRTEMFFLTLEEINSNPKILPNITLGWDIRDSCWYSPIALEQSIDFIKTSIASMDENKMNDSLPSCGRGRSGKPIAGLIGPGSSQNTIQVQNMLQMFHIPQIGYSATSMDLSNKNLYKYFLRVVPSDTYQAQALIDVVLRYNWTYISTVHSEGNYGEKGLEEFRNLAKTKNVCIANAEAAPSVDNDLAFNKIIETLLKTARARVIVCFCEGMTARRLMMAMKRIPKAREHFQILASDGWADRPDVVSGIEDIAVGAITVKLMSSPIPSFDTYFRSLKPENNSRNPWFREYWQWKFKCYLPWLPAEEQDKKQDRPCTGKEIIKDVVQDAKLGFVVKAIYALAHALHNMQQDLCEDSGICDNMAVLDGGLFLEYLLNVSFSYEGESVFFDEFGDPPPRYYIVNYQKHMTWNVNESYKYEMIGSWNSGVLTMDDNRVYWPQHNHGHATKSICSDECPKGHIKKVHDIACCWVCTPCQDNEIIIDSETCLPCSLGWWPNPNLTECVTIPIEYITWWNTEAMVALITACFGMFVTLWVGLVFIRHNNTPVVKASTRELMYIILIGVMMAFCSNFVLVARPTLVTCYFTRILPGMSFSLIYGSLVTKTNRIARILEGTKKIITKKPRFMSASAQVIITCIIIGVECAIITIMLVIEPADSKFDYPEPKRVKLICNTTTMGIIVPLGFDLVLIAMCTLYAIKTRNLPENFNEAKFIGFSMYTTCVIWLGFMAIYFGSERKVITMSVSVSLSAYVALVLLFFPKVYIIIWAPEKNTRSAFTTSKDVRCHIGSISCASGESIDLIRDVKQIDGLKVPAGRRRASFFQRLRYGGTGHHKRHQNASTSRLKRDATGKIRRENSFHVSATAGNSSSKGGSFSWAKMSAAGTSEEDRLSTISSKDGSEEVKRKHSLYRRDFGCQTEPELMESILNMPYLRRRCSQRIQRTRAIDEDYASVKFSPNNSMKVRYHRTPTDPVKPGKGPAIQQSKTTNRGDCRTFLFPGYSDSPLSTSDDIENEEDFEYYDSISDLLKAHKITPVYIDKKTPVCVNDKSMSTYLNPLGNRDINDSSIEEDSEKPLLNGDKKSPESEDQDGGVHLVVENNIDGTNTSVLKESPSSNSPFHVVTIEHNQTNHTGNVPETIDIPTQKCNQRNSICNESPKDIPMNSINAKRRSSSPIFSRISCHSLNISDSNDQNRRRPSALSQGSNISARDNAVQSFPGCKSADDMATTDFAKPVETKDKSMVEFQTFLRERGVELDMNYVESSEV